MLFTEEAKSTQGEIMRELKETIGYFRLYKLESDQVDHDTHYVSEEYMKKVVLERFGPNMDLLIESLESEALDGKLTLQYLYEALMSVDEEVDQSLIDFMLYYVYVRSEDAENLEVKVLVDLLTDTI